MAPIKLPRPHPGQQPPQPSAPRQEPAKESQEAQLVLNDKAILSDDGKGVFIVFEGGDSCGKSTHAQRLAATLKSKGYHVILTREPGGTQLGQTIRDVLLDPRSLVDKRTEALLYATDRAHHIDTVVRPALQRGDIVISDRYMDSSIAYQGAGRDMGEETIEALSVWATYGLQPHLTLIMDVDAAQAHARREGEHDRMEAAGLDFHENVRTSLLSRAHKDPRRYVIIDATEPKDEVEAAVWRSVRLKLGDKLGLVEDKAHKATETDKIPESTPAPEASQ